MAYKSGPRGRHELQQKITASIKQVCLCETGSTQTFFAAVCSAKYISLQICMLIMHAFAEANVTFALNTFVR